MARPGNLDRTSKVPSRDDAGMWSRRDRGNEVCERRPVLLVVGGGSLLFRDGTSSLLAAPTAESRPKAVGPRLAAPPAIPPWLRSAREREG
jgi:hypothetical protein